MFPLPQLELESGRVPGRLDVLGAVDLLHKYTRLLHCDVIPKNCMFRSPSQPDSVEHGVLIDFGAARPCEDPERFEAERLVALEMLNLPSSVWPPWKSGRLCAPSPRSGTS